MRKRKPYWLSRKDCGLLVGLIYYGDKIHLSDDEKHRLSDELLRHLHSLPRRPVSFLQEWAYPEIHRLVNGWTPEESWPALSRNQKRHSIRDACTMVAEVLKDGTTVKTLRAGYSTWKAKRHAEMLRTGRFSWWSR
jgi:hypothetical protein